jgi:hypothetical protein
MNVKWTRYFGAGAGHDFEACLCEEPQTEERFKSFAVVVEGNLGNHKLVIGGEVDACLQGKILKLYDRQLQC